MTDRLLTESASEQTSEPKLATADEWRAAWSAFHEATKTLNRLAIQDGITVTLSMRKLGWIPRGKKKAARRAV